MGARSNRRYLRNRAAILRGQPVCHICGQPVDVSLPYFIEVDGKRTTNPMAATADHDTALANGGGHEVANLKPAHLGCNRAKSDKAYAPIVRRSGTLA